MGDSITNSWSICWWSFLLQIHHNTMEYINIVSTTGNAVDFGDLLEGDMNRYGISNGHGGLG